MEETNFQRLLRQSFPASTREDWERVAASELNGNEPFKHLAWKDDDDIELLPYYDAGDASAFSYLDRFILPAEKDSFSAGRAWFNLPGEFVTEELSANASALEHLANGADGIHFHIDKDTDLLKLLAGIMPQYCLLSFQAPFTTQILKSFLSYFNEHHKKDFLNGILFWESPPVTGSMPKEIFEFPRLRPLGLLVPRSTPVREIHDALVGGVRVLESASEDGNMEDVVGKIGFSFELDKNFLSAISKIKAFRMLWFQVVKAFGIKSYDPSETWIRGSSEKWESPAFEPHSNMLKATTSAMAGILGGCNAITVYPQQAAHPTLGRIARNVSNILREEAHLDKVSDPLAGSYAVNAMVHEMARKSWALFQTTMKR